jgi:hypothetical protein
LTVPFSLADVDPMLLAALMVTAGDDPGSGTARPMVFRK